MKLGTPHILGGVLAIALLGSWAWDRWDVTSRLHFQSLHPSIQPKARALFRLAEQRGIILRMTSGLRSHEEQARLYAQGRSTPGEIVTNAKPGQSFHNYGMAFDVVPMVSGRPDWKSPHWQLIGQLGESVGLNWGGRWRRPDRPHFEFPISLTSLQQLKTGTLQQISRPATAKNVVGFTLLGAAAYLYSQQKEKPQTLSGTGEFVEIPDKTIRAAFSLGGTLVGYHSGKNNSKDTYPRTLIGGFAGGLIADILT